MQVEHHFADLSRYAKVSETSTPIDVVEWFAKNKGITNLDDPSVKIKTIIDDVNECELARQKARKAREAKAQDAFLDAMFNLNNGTAELRQKKDRTPLPVAKPKVAKTAKKVAKPAKKIAKAATVKKGPSSKQIAKARRDVLIADLSAGKMIRMVSESEKGNTQKDYQKQRADLVYIRRNMDITLIRLNRIQTGESYFMIDSLTRHKRVKLSGNLIGPDREPFIKALNSGKLFEASNITKGGKAGSASVANLADNHGMNIYSVISGRDLVGWVMPKDVEVALTE
ncbi:hypothetical protein BTW00_02150 [Psychrobacter sp. C 20.9]|uniref:hypothetical protein n=1 Tax=Psychrobacter sp. C 20.9 TaxID=1926477 RepID=UPI0009470C74|nr:hypothetical protein [Psychrobacter sp. C 20.9]OLF37985.1 hypothetical protein BTW00_02150 [Psychrobacter sp. C 20.9]